jgi:hypothetical protein
MSCAPVAARSARVATLSRIAPRSTRASVLTAPVSQATPAGPPTRRGRRRRGRPGPCRCAPRLPASSGASPLREQSADAAGQHVAAAGGGQAGEPVVLTRAGPSGPTTTVASPLSRTCTPSSCARPRALPMRSAVTSAPKRRTPGRAASGASGRSVAQPGPGAAPRWSGRPASTSTGTSSASTRSRRPRRGVGAEPRAHTQACTRPALTTLAAPRWWLTRPPASAPAPARRVGVTG